MCVRTALGRCFGNITRRAGTERTAGWEGDGGACCGPRPQAVGPMGSEVLMHHQRKCVYSGHCTRARPSPGPPSSCHYTLTADLSPTPAGRHAGTALLAARRPPPAARRPLSAMAAAKAAVGERLSCPEEGRRHQAIQPHHCCSPGGPKGGWTVLQLVAPPVDRLRPPTYATGVSHLRSQGHRYNAARVAERR